MPTSPLGSTPNRKPQSLIPRLTSSPKSSKKRKAPEISSIETSLDENGDIVMGGPLLPSRTPAISPDPQFGGPMNAINTMTGQPASSPPSQTGTWFSDTLEEKLKSSMEEIPTAADNEGQRAKRACASGEEAAIGWSELGNDADFLAATRGHCRYIDNHYPLTNPEIVLKNKSKEQYLIKSNEGCYLFKENLTEGRLVTQNYEETLARLQGKDVRYDGKDPIYASGTSAAGPTDGHQDSGHMDVDG